ncbi:MAG: aminotransferase class V-fold PLP-dependent enzyme [Gammaproteobacteria bacterium]|nr:aminotransferase class V-fold PLP-dependent enzyme [Gammaproteobacteria bacterium]
MPGRNFLFVPGPTNIPVSIQNAMNIPQEDHRRPDFAKLTKPMLKDVNRVFKTGSGRTFLFPATGTAGWEVALSNTLSPGDKVLTSRFGQFSHLWWDLAVRIGLDVETIDVPWGEGVPVERFKRRLERDHKHEIKAVMVCHNETATGVTSDIAGLRRAMNAAGHPAMLYVDGVSSIASIDFRMDEWEVDVAVSGSQKGFMLPAGMAIVCFSRRALRARNTAKCARCFLDIQDHINANKDGFFPYTPSIPLLHGLKRSLQILLEEEGLENIFKRHHRLAEGVRRAVDAWGLKLVAKAPKWHSDTVTAIRVPPRFDARDVIEIAYHRYNLSLGAGLSVLAGKAFRIGHLGDHNETSVLAALATAEMAMRDAGLRIQPGAGVGAALEYYRRTAPPLKAKLSSAKAAPAPKKGRRKASKSAIVRR